MWLDSQGVREVTINLHHLAEAVMEAAEAYRPPGITLSWSQEPTLLGTGGGIRRAAPFLRESDPSLVLAGDMLLAALLDRVRLPPADGCCAKQCVQVCVWIYIGLGG